MISGSDQLPPGGQPGGGEDDQPHGGGLGQQGLIPPPNLDQGTIAEIQKWVI